MAFSVRYDRITLCDGHFLAATRVALLVIVIGTHPFSRPIGILCASPFYPSGPLPGGRGSAAFDCRRPDLFIQHEKEPKQAPSITGDVISRTYTRPLLPCLSGDRVLHLIPEDCGATALCGGFGTLRLRMLSEAHQ